MFNLSNKVLSDIEIRVLEKGLDFAPIQNKLNKLELRRDFKEFCGRMRLKWHFRNEPTSEFSDRPVFSPKSLWNPPTGHPNLEVFLSQIEHELFQTPDKCLPCSNLSKDEWQAIRSLAGNRSVVIKKTDKGSCAVIWDRLDYLSEPEEQLRDKNIYKDVSFNDKILSDLVETSYKIFLNLKRKGSISEKEMKYFVHDYKNDSNLEKLYFLLKIHKRLSNVPGCPVISNCGTLTEKASEFLDYHLKLVM